MPCPLLPVNHPVTRPFLPCATLSQLTATPTLISIAYTLQFEWLAAGDVSLTKLLALD